MTTQPEALRLAEFLEAGHTTQYNGDKAAAELRRLHASCEDYAQHKQRQDQRVLELAERVLELKAQRDALLEALKAFANEIVPNNPNDPIWVNARAAIKAVEENT